MHFLRVSEAGMLLRSHQMFILALYLAHHLLTYLPTYLLSLQHSAKIAINSCECVDKCICSIF